MLTGEAGGALAKDLEELLSLKLGKAQLEESLREAREEAARATSALAAAHAVHEEHLATMHTAAATKQTAGNQQLQALQDEIEVVRRELEERSQALSEAQDRASGAEHQLHSLRTRVKEVEEEVRQLQHKRRQEQDALLSDMAQVWRVLIVLRATPRYGSVHPGMALSPDASACSSRCALTWILGTGGRVPS